MSQKWPNHGTPVLDARHVGGPWMALHASIHVAPCDMAGDTACGPASHGMSPYAPRRGSRDATAWLSKRHAPIAMRRTLATKRHRGTSGCAMARIAERRGRTGQAPIEIDPRAA